MKAEVVWTAEPTASEGGILHSVAFTQVTPDRQQALRELLRHKGQVRQAGVRLPIELSVLCRGKDEAAPLFQGRTGDISRAGLLLRLPQALPVGTALEVTLQTGHGPLAAEGTIIWVEPPQADTPGVRIHHGFRFSNMGWASGTSGAADQRRCAGGHRRQPAQPGPHPMCPPHVPVGGRSRVRPAPETVPAPVVPQCDQPPTQISGGTPLCMRAAISILKDVL